MTKPLEGLTVLEFSQFLSGPYAGLRLADLGARVIKIERPDVGDLCRNLYISDTDLEGDSTLFHAINRNKESFAANLKDPTDLDLVKQLISKADIITQNFRPGVIEKIGLDYENAKKINPQIVYGSISGYIGGKVDAFMMRLVDILYALPFLIFVILLMITFQDFDHQLILIFIAIGAVEWLTMARIVRGQVNSIKNMDFVEAARANGVPTASIIVRHLAPNILGPVIVYATLLVPAVMLLESTLSFLGLGVQEPSASWGTLIKDGADRMASYPWLLIVPSLFFSLTLFAMNFLGDGLRDALDVKSSKD